MRGHVLPPAHLPAVDQAEEGTEDGAAEEIERSRPFRGRPSRVRLLPVILSRHRYCSSDGRGSASRLAAATLTSPANAVIPNSTW